MQRVKSRRRCGSISFPHVTASQVLSSFELALDPVGPDVSKAEFRRWLRRCARAHAATLRRHRFLALVSASQTRARSVLARFSASQNRDRNVPAPLPTSQNLGRSVREALWDVWKRGRNVARRVLGAQNRNRNVPLPLPASREPMSILPEPVLASPRLNRNAPIRHLSSRNRGNNGSIRPAHRGRDLSALGRGRKLTRRRPRQQQSEFHSVTCASPTQIGFMEQAKGRAVERRPAFLLPGLGRKFGINLVFVLSRRRD
jgi:hypothetical protein